MNRHCRNLLFAAFLVLAVASYAGNALIGVGQGILAIALIASFWKNAEWDAKLVPDRKGVAASTWLLVALIGVNIVSIAANLDSYEKPFKDLKKVRHLILPVGVLLIPAVRRQVLTHARSWFRYVWMALVVTASAVTVADMINMLTGFHLFAPIEGIERTIRLGGVFGMVMTYGYSMQFLILVITGMLLLLWQKGRAKDPLVWRITLIAFLICGLGMFLSGSRGALLGCLIGAVVLVFVLRWRWLYFAFGGMFVVALIAAILLGNQLLEIRPNESSRFAQWKTAAVTGIENPVFGIGYRQFEKQSRDLKQAYGFPYDVTWRIDEEGNPVRGWLHSNAHNNYLEAFASTGIFGMLALLGFLLCWLREVWKDPDTRLLFGPAIIGFLVAGIFENSFTDGEVTTLVMMFYVGSQFAIKMGSSPDSEEQDV